MPEVLASVVLVASAVLVLALLGLPRRGSGGPGPATAGALVFQGVRTLQELTASRDRRLGRPWTDAVAPVAEPRSGPCCCHG